MPGPAGAAMLMAAKPGAILEGVRIAAKVFLLTIMFVFIIGALLVCFQVIIISSYLCGFNYEHSYIYNVYIISRLSVVNPSDTLRTIGLVIRPPSLRQTCHSGNRQQWSPHAITST